MSGDKHVLMKIKGTAFGKNLADSIAADIQRAQAVGHVGDGGVYTLKIQSQARLYFILTTGVAQ